MQITTKQITLLVAVITFIIALVVAGGIDEKTMSKEAINEVKMIRAMALGGLMIVLWLVEALPIYVTAMLPLALGVPMGILTGDQLAGAYSDKYVYLFLGGFMLALAMEKWDVHKQIARAIISAVGSSKSRVLLGFILSTGLLSMWISNTATTLMMLPMATAVVSNMQQESNSKFPLFLLLSIAYASSIGGMGTLIGSPTNTVMTGILSDTYGVQITFMDWMKYGMPLSILLLVVLFGYFELRMRGEKKGDKIDIQLEKKPWTRNQLKVIGLFLLVVLSWAFRVPITEWTGINYGDEHVAILAAILMFLIPTSDGTTMMEWKDMKNMAWGILLLFGGGLAMAKMLEVNGVILEIAQLFDSLTSMHILVLLLITVSIAIFGTEVMSNTALVSIFIPIVAVFAQKAEVPLMTLCLPVTLAASCAFMLPVGTPPNAIVFASGKMTIRQMAREGFMLNLICVVVIVAFGYFFLQGERIVKIVKKAQTEQVSSR